MNYWHMQMHRTIRGNFSSEIARNILQTVQVIGLGEWDNDRGQIEQFKNKMKIGDIVLIKDGETPIALVKITSDFYTKNSPNEDFDWFPNRRNVEVLDFYKDEYNFKIPNPRKTLSICKDLNNPTSKIIINWYNKIMDNNSNKKVIDLLKYKHQIILQGPPGTGKTYLAKLIAKEMTRSNKLLSTIDFIEDYVKNYVEEAEAKENKRNIDILLKEFHENFPKEKLDKLTLETYCQGSGSQNSFCYWLEKKLKQLGQFGPGSAGSTVYYVYFTKINNKYFTKNGEDPNEIMKSIAQTIYHLVNKLDTNSAKKYFRKSLILKILNSYYPNDFFPVYNQIHIANISKLFGLETKGLEEIEINKKINSKFYELKNKYNSSITNYELMQFLYGKFKNVIKSGTGEEEVIESVEYLGEYKLIQFHPAYSYEDFVRGISATTNENGEIEYNVEDRILAKFATKALKDQNNNYVLIIDEINRANLSSVLGELIYALEYRYDEKNPKDTIVESLYALKEFNEDLEENNEIKLPKNLYIIGTMNTADRSVGHIDYAIRRRFAFKEMLPDESVLDEVIKDEDLRNKAKKLFNVVANLFTSEFLATDFNPNQVQLGHSYFLATTKEELKLKLEYEIKPILEEYLRDGILLDNAKKEIDNINLQYDKSM